jgi:acyl-CoA synthetase (AMP-forming)/AMP-acid ligase II
LLGGNVKYISSGAAPLTPEVHEILKICFSCEAIQGYGMTEVSLTCSYVKFKADVRLSELAVEGELTWSTVASGADHAVFLGMLRLSVLVVVSSLVMMPRLLMYPRWE